MEVDVEETVEVDVEEETVEVDVDFHGGGGRVFGVGGCIGVRRGGVEVDVE